MPRRNVKGPNIRVNAALVCDDIRQETSGKIIVIGIYVGDIILFKFPSKLSLSFLLLGTADSLEVSLEVKIEVPSSEKEKTKTYTQVIDNTRSKDDKEFIIALVGAPITIGGTGNMSIKIRPKGSKNWKEVSSKPINLGEGL